MKKKSIPHIHVVESNLFTITFFLFGGWGGGCLSIIYKVFQIMVSTTA